VLAAIEPSWASPGDRVTLRGKNLVEGLAVVLPLAVVPATSRSFIRSDANCDGDIHIADAIFTLVYLFDNGADPTVDDLPCGESTPACR